MDVGLTTIDEKDITKHLPVAQAMVTRFVVLESGDANPGPSLPVPGGGSSRQFRPAVCAQRVKWT